MEEKYPMAIVTAPGKIEVQEKKLPEMGDLDVKIAIKATSICGSDLHIFKGLHPAAPLPMAVGHEISGEVVDVGKRVTNLNIGDGVAVEPVINCDICHYCVRGLYHLCTDISFQYRVGQGGITPYIVVPEKYAHKIPEGLSFEEGALIEPLSVALHAVKKANLQIGQRVAIFGAGAVGLIIHLLCKQSGVSTFLVDVNKFRLNKAKDLGATGIFNNIEGKTVEKIINLTEGLGVDVSFEAVGLEVTLVQALQVLKKGGLAILLGLFEQEKLNLPANIFVQKEIGLQGTQGYNWDFQDGIKLLEQGNFILKSLITHEFSFNDAQEAFDLLNDPKNEAIKIVLKS